MIIVRVELHSAISGKVRELARMKIFNEGNTTRENKEKGTYVGTSFLGRDTRALDRETKAKSAIVKNWSRSQYHVWNLVSIMLRDMGYTKGQ